MRARFFGIALSAAMVFAGMTVTFGQQNVPPLPAAGGGGAQRGGGGAGGGQRGGGGGGGRGGGGAAANQPIPRWPDGHPMLSPGPGEQKGLWHGAFSISATNVPYQPWA